MGRRKYRVGEKVLFHFAAEDIKGEVIKVNQIEGYAWRGFSKYKEKYTIHDGKSKYPVPYENIIKRLDD